MHTYTCTRTQAYIHSFAHAHTLRHTYTCIYTLYMHIHVDAPTYAAMYTQT